MQSSLPRDAARSLCVLAICAFATQPTQAQRIPDARIDRVLHGLRPSIAIKGKPLTRWSITERMALRHVPGISIAIIDSGRVQWAGGFGLRETGTTDSVTPSTLFEAQSISKPIAATAALVLADAKRLLLDENINTYLKSWRVPASPFLARDSVTLRRILTHSAGFTVSGFDGYRLGDSIPTLRQILNGQRPANNPAIVVDTVPGSVVRYSGGGMEVLQQLLVDVTGEPFPKLMKRLVLDRIGMTRSTYDQPLPVSRRGDAASGHDGDGAVIRGKWPINPELAAGGLWTTPTDLAQWMIAITNDWNGQSRKLLSKRMATEMLTVQREPYGLGVYVDGTGRALSFHHAGSNAGFRALLVMYPAVGKGAVIMTNGDRGDLLVNEILTSIATEYGWPGGAQTERDVVALTGEQLAGLVGTYTLPPAPSGSPVYFEVSHDADQVYGELRGLGSPAKMELYAASPDSFFTISGLTVTFVRDSSGRAIQMNFGAIKGDRRLP